MPQSAYIHIPFCKRKCDYCSFVSFEDVSLQNDYICALINEIKYFYNAEKLKTLYFGGGTPSLLDTSAVEKILNLFNFETDVEITFEANPDSVNQKYLKALKNMGINRLSLGVQTFDDKILKSIGRLHTAQRAVEAFEEARNAGFENINMDFIYGLPNQSLQDFEKDLKKAVSLNIEHISLYGLKIEEGSKFAKKKPANLPPEDLQADMFLFASKTLENMHHYEFSNYAKKEYDSKHNLNYWNNEEYYGFGIAAHGYTNGSRYSNTITLNEYLLNPLEHKTIHKLSREEVLQEEIFLGFRKCEGIDVPEINLKYQIDFDKKYHNTLSKFLDSKHILKTPKGYKLSNEGILLSNLILCEFL